MNQKEQIAELNSWVKTYIAPSKIHGVGVFALRDIPKDQKIFADITPKGYNLPYKEFSQLFPGVGEQLIQFFPQIINGSMFFHPVTRIVAFMNHSEEPNYDAVNDIMLKDVKKDKEITEDYRLIEGWEKVFTFLLEDNVLK